MVGKIVTIISGVSEFAGYISGYFKEKGIRDNQRVISELTATVKNLIKSNEEEKRRHKSELDALIIKHESTIEMLTIGSEADASPIIGARKITG